MLATAIGVMVEGTVEEMEKADRSKKVSVMVRGDSFLEPGVEG